MHNIQIINFRYRPTQRKYQLHRNRAEIGNKSMETQSVWLWHAAAINHNLTWHTCDALGNRLIVVYDTLIVSECDDAAAPKCFSSINNNIYNIASIPRPDPNKFHKQTNPLIHNFPCIFITSWQHNRKNWQPFGTTFERATWCWVGLSTMGNCSFFVCVLFLLSTINSTTYLLDQKSRQQRRHNKLHSVVKICHFYCEAAFIMFLDHWLPLNPYNPRTMKSKKINNSIMYWRHFVPSLSRLEFFFSFHSISGSRTNFHEFRTVLHTNRTHRIKITTEFWWKFSRFQWNLFCFCAKFIYNFWSSCYFGKSYYN